MQKEIKVWLEDIEKAILEINIFLPKSRNFREFQKDLKTKRAIEIIGKAMNRILGIDPDIRISDSRKIVDTRNRIRHGYDSVSDVVIWLIVIKYLPTLLNDVKELMKSYD